jgi:hypothetical protein
MLLVFLVFLDSSLKKSRQHLPPLKLTLRGFDCGKSESGFPLLSILNYKIPKKIKREKNEFYLMSSRPSTFQKD